MRLFILSYFLILSNLSALTSQIVVKEQLSPKEIIIFSEAKKAAQSGDIKKSIKKYEELLKSRPQFIEVILRLASNYHSIKSSDKSVALFREAINKAPDFDPEMYYSLALVLSGQKKYIEAADQLDIYTQKEKVNIGKVTKASFMSSELRFKDYALKNPVPFTPKKLGPSINSTFSEYSPSLSLDDSGMIFTRNNGQEDFYNSTKDTAGMFKTSSSVFQLNTPQNEGAHAISADGKFIVFTACDRRDSYGSCDLYYSTLSDGKWTKPVNLGQKINTAAWDSQPSLSPDGRLLIFSSRRLGTLGGSDLWVSWRNEKNAWVTPENLGVNINTEGNDETPFLHPDGCTLYFRSDGRAGMGNYDLYFSRKNLQTDQWQRPQNIGYPINTEGQEGGLVVSLDGKKGYFASDVDPVTSKNMGNLDIFSFDLYESARPLPSTFVKGNVTDAVSGKSIECRVTIKDLESGKIVFVINTDKEGFFLSGITTGRNYACIIEKDGYQYYAHNFDLKEVKVLSNPYSLHIKLVPLVNTTETPPVVMQNIFFGTGSSILLNSSQIEIDLLHQLLIQKPNIVIQIIGHTDNIGTDVDNMKLSESRAAAVVNALIDKGIPKERLKYEGKGETTPLEPNDTEEGRQKNRRTEFVIYNLIK